jgi:hypothetical protein
MGRVAAVRRLLVSIMLYEDAVNQLKVNMHVGFHRFALAEYATRFVGMRHGLSPITC